MHDSFKFLSISTWQSRVAVRRDLDEPMKTFSECDCTDEEFSGLNVKVLLNGQMQCKTCGGLLRPSLAQIEGQKEFKKEQINPGAFPEIEQEFLDISARYIGGIGSNLIKESAGELTISERLVVFVSKKQLWQASIDELISIQIGGAGAYQTGGGWTGGGFGLKGALEGAVFASIMNSLTTKTKFDCLFRMVFPKVDITFQVLDRTPVNLEIDLTGVRRFLNSKGQMSPNLKLEGGNNLDLLLKLADLVDKGLITKKEFDAQKKKLL